MSLVFNIAAFMMAVILYLVTTGVKKQTFPVQWQAYFFLGVVCLFYGLYERLRFHTTKALEASHLTVINNLALVTAVFFAFFVYREKLGQTQWMGFLLIVTALILTSIEKIKKADWNGILIAIVANIFLGIGWGLDKKGLSFFSPETYSLLTWFFPIAILLVPSIKIREIKRELKNASKIIFLSILNVIGYYLNLKAMALAPATKVIPIVQTSTLFTIFMGIIFLNEKDHLVKKIIAGLIAVSGVFLII